MPAEFKTKPSSHLRLSDQDSILQATNQQKSRHQNSSGMDWGSHLNAAGLFWHHSLRQPIQEADLEHIFALKMHFHKKKFISQVSRLEENETRLSGREIHQPTKPPEGTSGEASEHM